MSVQTTVHGAAKIAVVPVHEHHGWTVIQCVAADGKVVHEMVVHGVVQATVGQDWKPAAKPAS